MLLKLVKQGRYMLANINPPSGYKYGGITHLFFLEDDFHLIKDSFELRLFTNSKDIELTLDDGISSPITGSEINTTLSNLSWPQVEITLITPTPQYMTLFAEVTYQGKTYTIQLKESFISPEDQRLDTQCSLSMDPETDFYNVSSFPVTEKLQVRYFNNSKLKQTTRIRAILDSKALFINDNSSTDCVVLETTESMLISDLQVSFPDYGLYTLSLKLEGTSPMTLDKTTVSEGVYAVIRTDSNESNRLVTFRRSSKLLTSI